MSARRIAVGSLLVCLVGGAAVGARAWLAPGAPEASSSAPDVDGGLRLSMPRGVELVYELSVRATSTRAVAGLGAAGAVQGEMDIAADLTLRSHGPTDGAFVVEAGIAAPSRHVHRVLGADTLPDAAAFDATFAGRRAFVAMEPSGRVRWIRFESGDAPLFKHLMHLVLGQIGLALEGDDSAPWNAVEPGPSGTARVRYQARRVAGGGFEIDRTRVAYESLAGLPADEGTDRALELAHRGAARIDAKGLLRSLQDEERLVVRRGATQELASTFQVRLESKSVARAAVAAVDLDGLVPLGEADVLGAAEQRRAALRQLAGDLTFAEVERTLGSHAKGVPLDRGWLSRAAALLELEPHRAARIAELLRAGALDRDQRALALDLCAAAGSPQAQAAMRSALAVEAGRRGDPELALLVQRLGFVRDPAPETVAFLAEAHQRAAEGDRPHVLRATAQALGSVAGKLAEHGRGEEARAQTEQLATELDDAGDARDKAALLSALGNTGMPDQIDRIAGHASDADPEVRTAAALALRKMDDPAARGALLGMAGDVDPSVTRAALDALRRRPLSSAETARLCGLVIDGRTAPLADGSMVTFLASQLGAGQPVEDALRAMLARAADPALAERIRALLGESS